MDEASPGEVRPKDSAIMRFRAFARGERDRLRARYRPAPDLELANLQALEAAYAEPSGPDVLLFGDSAMFWASPFEPVRTPLHRVVQEHLPHGTSVLPILGSGYSARIVRAYLLALERCASRPKVVVVTNSILVSMDIWLAHPDTGLARQTDALLALIEAGRTRPERLPSKTTEESEAFEHLPVPSLLGLRRTVGELDMLIAASPTTRWQHVIRQRHIYDYYLAEELKPDGTGPQLVRAMARQLAGLGLPSVAYIAPVNVEMAARLLGDGAVPRVAANGRLLGEAYVESVGPSGTLVAPIDQFRSEEFIDPIHLNEAGRQRFGPMIAAAVTAFAPFVNEPDYEPARHYDRVTGAGRLLLGEELHYGVFTSGDEPLPVATNALTRLMIDGAQLSPGLRVLDVGCGTGAPACQLAVEFDVHVTGITTSQVGVDSAKARAEATGLEGRTSFEVRDGTDNGLADGSFDRVWVLESSHLMRERSKLIAECARVLAPGGRMVLCDLVRHREIPFLEVRERRADFVTLRDAFGDAHFEPLGLYQALAEEHGLAVESARDLTAQTLPTFDRWRANFDAHRVEVVDAIGEEAADAFRRSTDILEGFWRDGTFGYGLLVASRPVS